MRIATLDLAPEIFMEFVQGSKDGPPRYFQVKENPLPDDARVVSVSPRTETCPMIWRLFIESESFADVAEGDVPPELPWITYEVVYAEASQMVA